MDACTPLGMVISLSHDTMTAQHGKRLLNRSCISCTGTDTCGILMRILPCLVKQHTRLPYVSTEISLDISNQIVDGLDQITS